MRPREARWRSPIDGAASVLSLAAYVALAVPGGACAAKKPLDVASAVQTRRFVSNGMFVDGQAPAAVVFSPDGSRYIVRLIHGDMARDGVWTDILVGGGDSLRTAKKITTVASLFTRGYEHLPHYRFLLNENFNPLTWIDARHVAFRWEDAGERAQVVALDVDTRELRFLTNHSTDVAFFKVGPNGQILYGADSGAAETARREEGPYGGSYVESTDGFALAEGVVGHVGTLDLIHNHELFLFSGDGNVATDLNLRLRLGSSWTFAPKWSADGRYVVVVAWVDNPSAGWKGFLNRGQGVFFDRILGGAFENSDGWFGRQLTELYLVDTQQGTSRPLLDAPVLDGYRLRGEWSPNGRQFVVGPTFLPQDRGRPAGTVELSMAAIDISTGAVTRIAAEHQGVTRPERLVWRSSDVLDVITRDRELRFAYRNGQWNLTGQLPRNAAGRKRKIELEIREDLNTPPALYAVDAQTGRSQLILDPNPGFLKRFTLGRAALFECTDPAGRHWKGVLYYPADYSASHRYPLVIQVLGHGVGNFNRFHLYGSVSTSPGLGPSQSIYAAQLLANRGIFVLNIERQAGGSHEEAEVNVEGFEAAVARLDALGLIDTAKVGIGGESRPGWLAEEAITFSKLRYAAAIVSDSTDTTFSMATLLPDLADSVYRTRPFGAGLKDWLERSTGFNVERIQTPLRLEDESEPGAQALSKWELFSRLRSLNYPVEYYLVPDLERGSHIIENPHQLLAVKQGAVDWFDFWLNDREDADPRKASQYVRWHRMRQQRDEVIKSPRPPRLIWSATPLEGSD